MIFAFSALQYPQAPLLGSSCVFTVWPAMIWLGRVLRLDGSGGPVPVTCFVHQRATHNQVAMRAAYLVMMALGEDKMSLQSLEFLLCHVWHLGIPLTRLVAYCILIGSWVTLGLICRLTIFLVGQRILFMVMVFSLKSRTLPISCKVCLSIN